MRYLMMVLIFLLLQLWVGPVWAQSDHGKPDAAAEVRASNLDARRPFVLTGCEFAVSVGTCTR